MFGNPRVSKKPDHAAGTKRQASARREMTLNQNPTEFDPVTDPDGDATQPRFRVQAFRASWSNRR
jgi:hypothetical protein